MELLSRKRGCCLVLIVILVSVCMEIVAGQGDNSNRTTDAKYIIIGAGLAGLSAAMNLALGGETDFLILEGSDRIGGRVKSAEIGGKTVQLGAQWLQGGGANDVIYALADETQLVRQESDYEDVVVLDGTGNDVTDAVGDRWTAFDTALTKFYDLAERLENEDTEIPDISQRDALSFYGWRPQTGTEFALEFYDMDFTYGQAPETASTRFGFIPMNDDYSEEIVLDQVGGGLSKVVGALSSKIPDFAANDPRLHFDALVTSIKYDEDGVEVSTADGTVYTGRYVILTASLGVLKNEAISFTPALPEWKRYSIQGSTYVTDYPIYLKFPSNFWGDTEYIIYGSDRRGYFSLWQNFDKFWPGSNILQIQMAGTEGKRIARIASDSEAQAEIMAVLRTMFGQGIPDPDAILRSEWDTDHLFLGSYSDWSPAFPSSSHDALRAPIGRVYFAGEAYSRDWFGYMQGAILSGKDETDKLLECDRNATRCEVYDPDSRDKCGTDVSGAPVVTSMAYVIAVCSIVITGAIRRH